jgi:hypothetical protein
MAYVCATDPQWSLCLVKAPGNLKFRSILEDALRRLLGEKPEILDEDPHV